jgi:toxin FitB
MLILDTDVVSLLRRSDRFPDLAAWHAAQDDSAIFISVVTIGEVERGIVRRRSKNPVFAADLARWAAGLEQSFADRILQFGIAEAKVWGQLCGRLGYESADLMIAATAIVRGATVVTRNERDFARAGAAVHVPG